ncbi:hypothetical protein IFM58399_03724 [Aspergillus lentulus]|uniref:Bacteriophage T5 Orf172 DNA-binding domain-containing protein n=1 Tax=Aspergillus lentulus TaxID=293939 RepID=A0AAN5YS20_ASPLE|nr:uncharacterized protein IFM58399_03724 [Aspergillus lentulus]KAF4152696.1 hypothetical protein CNMCM6069_001798 [Aspergillus lentulus]KAF4164435.1 hypothetical protein CNMCM6936_009097 [Aspergillus lentulus]KAF4181598.1 hypothetical protein CNMCM8060_008765 [Aspergillus lentulus]KAF4188709.1 hypothetical protein CNMCM7927_000883 [Aspergillus lentulus]KAF4191950.1 hypothetical protein CNMCM8694_001075 [Aspergillus lentulus]
MPHIANTPESMLSRSDSLDPATTCRGVTSNGRPCRRALAASTGPRKDTASASMYCWQHKDQATASNNPGSTRPPQNPRPKPRTSIDTLMDRLGVLEINDPQAKPAPYRRRKPKKRTVCCCFEIIEDLENERPPRPVTVSATADARPSRPMQQVSSSSYPGRPKPPAQKPSSQSTLLSPQHASHRPSLQSSPASSSSHTTTLLAWIPPTLTPQTTSNLLTELAKPISEADEPGYIYMFWVTPSSSTSSPPPAEVARSLVPEAPRPGHGRRVSDALKTAREMNALTSKPTGQASGTIRLKIGRTSNVQRRLNEWSRQCSHHLTLIRYYPYTPSTPSPSPSPVRLQSGGNRGNSSAALEPGRKVPHVHRVERLIHLELGEVRVRDLGRCQECGKEHREWFEVSAEKQALKRVDECIRRWVEWAESQKL